MAEPFLGEIRLFSFNFAPKGWAMCDGQTLAINQNTALFALLGTMFGGNGTTTFQLPNAQGAVFMGAGNSYVQGEVVGSAAVTLNSSQVLHTHLYPVGGSGTLTDPSAGTFGTPAVNPRLQAMYSSSAGAAFAPNMLSQAGSSAAHNNMQPYLVLNYCIALAGIFPSRN